MASWLNEGEGGGGEEEWGGEGGPVLAGLTSSSPASLARTTAEATTAEEYLRLVREEANRLPEVLVSESSHPLEEEYREGGGVDDPCEGCGPGPSVYDEIELGGFVSDFDALRLRLGDESSAKRRLEGSGADGIMPGKRDKAGWLEFCGNSANKPTLTLLSSLQEPAVVWLLQNLIEDVVKSVPGAGKGLGVSVTEGTCTWIFALSVKIHKPLSDDSSASFRSLVKFCVENLERCQGGRLGRLGEGEVESDRLKLLLAIAGCYFGQDEFLSQSFASRQRL
ncbi:SIP1 domain-containing protein [Chloropicon primus]|uniref:Gem-associated protein 2 n=1 Tax=Chloropicon primus TaxID=1764295 RepID=A0A5B8MKA5_9CHLO|nr:hypothetical protein A3770_04p34010 [Chloropicon primus]UPR00096.1 SIP1 domain-containing protein [Chloropicon primus]|eukprot:QDZ20883.1 hypothetical protein A3770_04p34010 [Chloropicon primus]